ncbi:MAG: MBL fold metallo-hydrolase [Bacilli bacterium]|nr:MBL fold metallo-hydrolase [Bacilli bacterium]
MLSFAFVGSGSKGNATLIYSGKTLIQVDMGVSLRRIKESLKMFDKKIEDIQGLLITHDHSDHIGTIPLYKGKVPIYASLGTYDTPNLLMPGIVIEIGDIKVMPFSTSHDAANPIGFIFECDGEKMGYVTDTGILPEEAQEKLNDCDFYLFESNHDYRMLMASKRPPALKRRIHSDHGHLSNSNSAAYMMNLIGPRTKEIYLAHLSEECNTPEYALAAYEKAFEKHNIDINKYIVMPLKQWETVYGGHRK